MTDFFKNIKEKIIADGWIYFIGSMGNVSGLYKAQPDGSKMKLLYKCEILPSFLSNYLKSIWKVEDDCVFFTVQSSLYRVKDDPDDPYSESNSFVDFINYKTKLDGTQLEEVSRSVGGVGTYSKP
ncbi:MAG: hypothetical protein FWC10_02280 [Lentimicrobiaceae bacterium]|nr:hypothetical protein [Lentimicrobiaceae bacterium]